MSGWVELQRKKIEEGKQAEMELSQRIAKFLTATSRDKSGDTIYGELKSDSVRFTEEGGEEFICGQIAINKEYYGASSDGFKIKVSALNDIDETLRKVSEFHRLTGF